VSQPGRGRNRPATGKVGGEGALADWACGRIWHGIVVMRRLWLGRIGLGGRCENPHACRRFASAARTTKDSLPRSTADVTAYPAAVS